MQVVPLADLGAAATAVDAGGVVIVPTSRWYMLCGRADFPEVAERIFLAKRRPESRSLLLAAPSTETVRRLFTLSPVAGLLAEAFWPGDLALLLPWQHDDDRRRMTSVGSPALVAMPGGALGELSRLLSGPLAATSVNLCPDGDLPGSVPAVTVNEVRQFVDRSGADIAVVVDGGVCPHPVDMTIVDCTDAGAVLRREGMVRTRSVAAVLGEAGMEFTGVG
ncbi:L-threonylcarbamoyladenylate synthase [Dactylosporangium sp. CA-092794]|uniref:L-threonylcarbamoyladenylate synthase n=1 Tax=Dactylosporangium sp. CA-092794 TaxID=3239929 RepID=UPI003D8FA840